MDPTGASLASHRPYLGGYSTEAQLGVEVQTRGEWRPPREFRSHDDRLGLYVTVAERLCNQPGIFEGYCEALSFFSPAAAAFVRDHVPGSPAVLSRVVRHHQPVLEAPRRVAELQNSGSHEAALGFLKGWSLLDSESFARVVPAALAAQAIQLG